MSWKKDMSRRKTVVLTTRSSDEPAAASTALMLSQQAAVRALMSPVTTSPEGVPGIWPETKM
jgi:hypothetical protein